MTESGRQTTQVMKDGAETMQDPDHWEDGNDTESPEELREPECKHPSIVAELFAGSFRWDLIHPFPEQPPEDKRLGDGYIEQVRRTLEEYIDPNEVDRTGEVPEEALLALAEIGCFGLRIPKEYGGVGLSQMNYNRVIGFIASYCSSTAAWISAHQSIGMPQSLLLFGTREQKEKYLPRLARGAVSGFALTEPQAGSDPARLTTTATPIEDGAYYLLNGEKLWCTNGPSAELLVVMARTSSAVADEKNNPEITAFIVETNAPGFEIVHRCEFMGIRGISNGLLRFRNVRVPKDNIIGELGQGLEIALATLDAGRLAMAAVGAAYGKVAVHFAHEWCNKREQWGAPIGRHQAVAEKTVDMVADTFAMDSMDALVCAVVDRGGSDTRLEAAMAKYYCTETAWRIADDLLQIRGGRGFETTDSLIRRGEEPVPADRMLRDARVGRILEGASEMLRLFIAREVMGFHMERIVPVFGQMGDASMFQIPGRLWKLWRSERDRIWPVLWFYLGWYPRQWAPSLAPEEAAHLSMRNRAHLRYVAHAARKLARVMFHAMVRHGQRLENEHVLLGAIVDIGAEQFAMGAVLARAEQLLSRGEIEKSGLEVLVDYYCMRARRRVGDGFRIIRQNPGKQVDQVGARCVAGEYAWLSQGVYTAFPPQFLSAGKVRESALLQPDLFALGAAERSAEEAEPEQVAPELEPAQASDTESPAEEPSDVEEPCAGQDAH